MFRTIQKTKKSILLLITIALFLTPFSYNGSVQTTHAALSVIDSANLGTNIKTSVESTISAAAETVQTGLQTALNIKELTLDGIAFGLMKTVLKGVTSSILNWINSGFQGSPAFVTDLDGFLLDVADQVAGDFIYGTELGFLCSPFELDVRIALSLQYQQSRDYQPQCTISEITDNIEGFLGGDFSQGGWPAWFELTQNPSSNPTGAVLAASTEMGIRLQNAEGKKLELLAANDFFLNLEFCENADSAAGGKEDCKTTTPGKIISDQLTFELQTGSLALIEADEINEIIGALFAQLAQQALTGAYGLLGMGGSSYEDTSFAGSSGRNYLTALEQETINNNEVVGNALSIDESIAVERRNIQLQERIRGEVQSSLIEIEQAIAQFTIVIRDPNTNEPLLDENGEEQTGILNCFANEIPTIRNRFQVLANHSIEAQQEISLAEMALNELGGENSIKSQFEAATSSAAQQVAFNRYFDLVQAGAIKNDVDLVVTELFIENELQNAQDELEEAIEVGRTACTLSGL